MTRVSFGGVPVPRPEAIKREFMEVGRAAREATMIDGTIGDWLEEHRNADRLLDLYIDLGYLAVNPAILTKSTTSTLHLEPAPAQGYEPLDYEGA